MVLIAQGDRVAVEIALSGTFSQPFAFIELIPPTNQPVLWTELDFLRFKSDNDEVACAGPITLNYSKVTLPHPVVRQPVPPFGDATD